MKKLDIRVLRVLRREKVQYIAITMVIVLGLMSYIALGMALNNLDVTVDDYYELTQFSDGYIDFLSVSESNVLKIGKTEGIENIEGRIVDEVRIDVKDENVRAKIITEPKLGGINQLFFDSGSKTLDSDREIFVINQFAKARGYSVGDEIPIIVYGKKYTMIVKNIVDSPEFIYLAESEQTLLPDAKKYGVIYVTESFAQSALDFNNYYNQVLFSVKDGYDEANILDEIDENFDKLGITRLTEKKNQLSNRMLTEEIEGGRKSITVIPVIFLSVAAIILVFMINRLIKNDRTMIGILKAMGYSNKKIIFHYSKLTVLIGLVGSILGISMGFKFSAMLAQLYVDIAFNIPMLTAVFYPVFAVNAVVLSILFTVAAGLWGSRGVLKIQPAESMRPEPPKAGKKIWIERYDLIWDKITFDWKLVIRSAIRNKKRLLFTMIGIAMTYSLTLMPISMMDSYDTMFVSQFEDFQTMDYNVNFKTFVSDDEILDIEKATEASGIEGKLEIPFEIECGSKNKIVSIIGLEQDSEMYHFVNTKGKDVQLPDEGVFVTESIVNYFGYKIGDEIYLKTFIPGSDDISVKVKGVIKQTLGINMYANLDYMQKMIDNKGIINSVMLNSDTDVKDALEDYEMIASVMSLQDIRDTFMEFMDYTIYSVSIMLIFALVLGFAIVYNSGIMTINERQLEFSSMRVMGFTKKEIFKMITRETMVISTIGIIVGIPLGQAMLISIGETFSNDLYTMDMGATPLAHYKTIAMTSVFILISVLATYEKIHRLNFIDALKNRMT
ncbi:MAG: FtsX-like permease family protein [Bacillota bacterium]|nr:FtsX-like permease family protein [Bacillota bacterium]